MRLVIVSALVEAIGGLILIVAPSVFAHLVFGGDFSEIGTAVARLGGFALLTIAVLCWPAPATFTPSTNVVRGLLFYNAVAALYLAELGVGPKLAGVLLWPAVALHTVLALLFLRLFLSLKRA